MRVGAEPSPRLLSQAVRWQLADQAVRRYRGELPTDIGALSIDARATCSPWPIRWPITSSPPSRSSNSAPGCWLNGSRCPMARASGRRRATPPTDHFGDAPPRAHGPGARLRRGQARRGRLRRPDDARRATWRPCPRSPRSSAPASAPCCSMSTKTPATRRSSCSLVYSATATRSPRSAIRSSRSMAGAARARATSADSLVNSATGRRRAGRGLSAVDQLAERPPDPGRRQRDRRSRCGPLSANRRRARRGAS